MKDKKTTFYGVGISYSYQSFFRKKNTSVVKISQYMITMQWKQYSLTISEYNEMLIFSLFSLIFYLDCFSVTALESRENSD